jgi:hypothetical protein
VAGLIGATWIARQAGGGEPVVSATPPSVRADVEAFFLQILRGFLRNARATSDSYAVCDFPEGNRLKGCCTPAGKTYVSVARMLPAIADYLAGGGEPIVALDGNDNAANPRIDLREVLLSIYRSAFDPGHPDYWGEPPTDKPTQRTVESALIGASLVRLGDDFVAQLTASQRASLNRWLASCTVVPERVSNHAWFTAINQASRLRLAGKFSEFAGDEKWMLADLEALDRLFVPGNDGWYSDAPDLPVYDYYNFWTFGNFPLLWGRVIGERYPQWDAKFRERVKLFLQKTPYFFAANGAHPLFGRSLIYRWALLSPLVLGYELKLWPHAPGLLRRIVSKSLEYHRALGAYDEKLGKLRETYSPQGTPDVKEAYIDNGHPYWAMLSFSMLSIPASDPLWSASVDAPLPIEKEDFTIRFEGPRMLLIGNESSGQVRWVQARVSPRRDYYRDKYIKFAYSSHFPFNVLRDSKDRAPWDQTLVFRDRASGAVAARGGTIDGKLTDDGLETQWWAKLGDWRIEVNTRLRLAGEFEMRTHEIALPDEVIAPEPKIELIEGSSALGLAADEEPVIERGDGWLSVLSRVTGHRVVTWDVGSGSSLEVAGSFEESGNRRVNLIYPRVAVNTLRTTPRASKLWLRSLYYASPRPLGMAELQAERRRIVAFAG